MFQAQDMTSNDFVLVQANWSLGQAIDVCEYFDLPTVIVHRIDDDEDENNEYFYLRNIGDFSGIDRELSVYDALDLSEWQAELVVDGLASMDPPTTPVVVMSDQLVLGYIDVGAAPPVPPQQVAPPPVAQPPERTMAPGGQVRGGGGWEAAAPAAPVGTEVTRHLDVQHPREAEVGVEFDVVVEMAGDAFATPDPDASFEAQVGDTVDLIISTRPGLELIGVSKHRLIVNADGSPIFCQFKLRATEQGNVSATVIAFIDGAQVGAIPIGVQARAAGDSVDDTQMHREVDVEPSTRRQADLMLVIYEVSANGRRELHFQLNASDPGLKINLKDYGPIVLEMDPARYFSTHFADIEALIAPDGPPSAEVEQRMKVLGAALYEEIVPLELRTELWGVRDRIHNVFIQSTDPWIPWEMCFVTGPSVDGEIIEHGYLCETYDVSRWIQSTPLRPDLSLERIGLVVTGDSGLPMAVRERDNVLALGAAGRTVESIEAEYLPLTAALAGGTFTALHFVGHGLFADGGDPDKTKIELQDGTPFTAQNISGRVANLGKAQPLVFLNACQVGRAGMTLAGPGGWARALLTAGAGGFVGTHWSVLDEAAVEFSRVMYERLIAGDTAPKAVRAARSAIRSAGDPTWLAYVLYSDPFARLV